MEILFILFLLEETHAVALPEWPVGLAARWMLHACIGVSILGESMDEIDLDRTSYLCCTVSIRCLLVTIGCFICTGVSIAILCRRMAIACRWFVFILALLAVFHLD